ETLRWTVVQHIEPGSLPGASGAKPGAAFSDFGSIIVLQKSYECRECGKTFSCSSHFSKHRRTHTG
ncbi:ZSC29 protein, partial [Calyptomena viridis]|nr:ZSC29 protein [Calyptomena viridis]